LPTKASSGNELIASAVAGLQTEFTFTLPKGYVDSQGRLHRVGTMRLATARDEIEPLRDPRVTGPEDPYLTILVLSRVVTELGSLASIGVDVVENLFAADLAFLQDLYGIINFGTADDIAALERAAGVALEPEPAPTPPVSAHRAPTEDTGEDLDVAPTPSAGRRRERIQEVVRPAES
jgi:hypothetical protein